MRERLDELRRILCAMKRVIVAYSGGVDSTFLLEVAHDCLGADALRMVGVSSSLARRELTEAEQVARQIGARCEAVRVYEMDDPHYVANDARRCYYCKSTLFRDLMAYAGRNGYAYVLDGSHAGLPPGIAGSGRTGRAQPAAGGRADQGGDTDLVARDGAAHLG